MDKILGFERATYDRVSSLVNKLSLIEAEQKHIDEKIDTLVSRLEFTPVKMLVYGMTSITLSSVVGALVLLVLNK